MNVSTDTPASLDHSGHAAPLWQPAITIGFGTAVAMWLVGFVTHLPGMSVPPAGVGVAMLVVWLAGAFVGGRMTGGPRSLRIGVAGGLVTGLVNLLILGSLLSTGEGPNELRPNWAALLAGYFVFSGVIGAVGGWLGGASAAGGSRLAVPMGVSECEVWLARFAKVAVLAVVPVIFSGGLVTSAKAGLAVPDWPNSFGSNMFLFPLSRMTGGIYYEHAHRLFGTLIGLTTFTLMVFTLVVERRRWAKALVAGVLALVCLQGALGGLGVTAADAHAPTTADALAALPNPAEVPADYATRTDTGTSRTMRMVHGVLGQITFGMLCAVASVLSMTWKRRTDADPADGTDGTGRPDAALRFFTSALLVTLLMQLALGAASRHFQHMHALFSHAGFAVFVMIAAAMAAFRAMKFDRPLKSLAHGVLHTVVLQAGLGLAALFLVLPYDGSGKEGAAFVVASLHQANGAALLGISAALWAWARR